MLDIIILCIIIAFGLVGYKRGLMRSALTLISSIVSLVLSFFVYPLVSTILKISPLYQVVLDFVKKQVDGINFGGGLQSQGNAIVENIKWLPSALTEQIKNNNNAVMYDILGVNNIKDYVSVYITQMLIGLLALLVTWIVIKMILTIVLGTMSGIVEHLPIISNFNHAGGLIFGILKALLTLSIIALIIPVFIGIPTIESLYSAIQESLLTKYLYENNLIIAIYNYFFKV